MDRAEARRRLESTTEFVTVGNRLVVRNVRLLDLIASRPLDASTEHVVRLDALKPYELRERAA